MLYRQLAFYFNNKRSTLVSYVILQLDRIYFFLNLVLH